MNSFAFVNLFPFLWVFDGLLASNMKISFFFKLASFFLSFSELIAIFFLIFWLPFCWTFVGIFSSNTFIFMLIVRLWHSSFLIWSFFIGIAHISFEFKFRIFFRRSSSLRSVMPRSCFISVRIFILNVAVFIFLRFGFVPHVVGLIRTGRFSWVSLNEISRSSLFTVSFVLFNFLLKIALKSPLNSTTAKLWIKMILLLRSVAFYPGHCSGE